MSDLIDFLLARIGEAEDEADWIHHDDCATHNSAAIGGFPCDCPIPRRVLAECEAKRRIVTREMNSVTGITYRRRMVLQDLAAVYADHPDYRDEWRP